MNEDYPMVALAVPVHNNKEDTLEFLESLKCVIYPNYRVIIIDDGSTDGIADMIKTKYPYVILLKGNGSLWWAGATNIGIEKAIEIGADYVLLGGMNDTIVDSEFLSALVDVAEKNPGSITTSKCYFYQSKRIQHIGWQSVSWLKYGFGYKMIGLNEIDVGQYDSLRNVEGATISVLVRTTFFKEIGTLHSNEFPQYYGDFDFSYRAYKKGYGIIFVPKSIIWHKDSSSIKKSRPKKTSFFKVFIYLTSDKRSMRYFPAVMNFYLRYCPFYALPFVFARYFRTLIMSSLKHQMG